MYEEVEVWQGLRYRDASERSALLDSMPRPTESTLGWFVRTVCRVTGIKVSVLRCWFLCSGSRPHRTEFAQSSPSTSKTAGLAGISSTLSSNASSSNCRQQSRRQHWIECRLLVFFAGRRPCSGRHVLTAKAFFGVHRSRSALASEMITTRTGPHHPFQR